MAKRSSKAEIDISQPSDFNVFISQSDMYLWNWGDDEKIHCRKVDKDEDIKQYEKHKQHMRNLHKDIFLSPKKKDKKSLENSFADAIQYTHTDIFFSPKKKKKKSLENSFADTIQYFESTQTKKKLFCRIEGNYLVKKYFTEGVQCVKPGEIHKYKVIGRALDIYTTNSPLEPKTFRSIYDKNKSLVKISLSSGDTKIINSNTSYIVIAPCHTFFKKEKLKKSGVENSTEMSTSFATEADFQITNVSEDINGFPSSERRKQTEDLSTLPRSSESGGNTYGKSKHTVETEDAYAPELVNGVASRGPQDLVSWEGDRPSKRKKYTTPSPRPSTSQMGDISALTPPNYLRDEMEFENDSELVIDSGTRSGDNDKQSELVEFNTSLPRTLSPQTDIALAPPSPNTLFNEVKRIGNIQEKHGTSIDNQCRAVFAVRKDSSIESYTLRSDSTFRVLQDNIMTGKFTIENYDMDPCVFEYHGDVQYIREIARFKNGSVFETTLTVQKDLLNELRDPSKKTEKVVVNYFFEFTFKALESAYKKFGEMRNMKMIGSCVPAIVPMSNARFCGPVSDNYEAKPY